MGADAPTTTTGQIAEAVLLDGERRRKLFNYACSRFGIAVEDAEDLLQETALELLRYRSYVRSPEGFVFAVFRARCARFTEARRTRRAVFSQSDPADAAEPETSESPERTLALQEALSGISTPCRRLLSAYYMEGQSLREAARTMSLAYSSMAKTISRCLRKIRETLG